MNAPLRKFGFGALIGGGLAVLIAVFIAALLIGPLIFWLAWNVLDFGPAIGLPELGFWSIVLATLFLIVGWFGKSVITAIVFIADPSWLGGAANVSWPTPSFTNFIAVVLLAILASRPHAHAHKQTNGAPRRPDRDEASPWEEIATEVRTAISASIEHGRPGTPA